MGRKRNIAQTITKNATTRRVLSASRPGYSELPVLSADTSERLRVYGVDLSELRDFPGIGPAFLEGFRIWAGNKLPNTRHNTQERLRNGFLAFLKAIKRTDIALQDVDRALLQSFVKWLDRPQAKGNEPWEIGTRRGCVKGLRAVLSGLSRSPLVGKVVQTIRAEIPKNSWPGASRKSTPVKRLLSDKLQEILAAAEREIEATMKMVSEGQKLIEDGLARILLSPSTAPNFDDLAVCLATVDKMFPDVVPDIEDIEAINLSLGKAIRYTHGALAVTKYLYPSSRLLAPFVVFFDVQSALNSESIRTLEWSHIQRDTILGYRAIRFWDMKKRASRDSAAYIAADGPPGRLGAMEALDFLENWTVRLRRVAPAAYHDRVFMFVQATGAKSPKSFGLRQSATRDITWIAALRAFCRDNNLEQFALNQIRTTMIDEMQQVSGDIAIAQRFARHRDRNTTWRHYTSDGTRRKQREELGDTFLLRTRWWQTHGVVDPRTRTPTQDRGSCTPGFWCFDPFDSPMPNQIKGRLCTAYGECPVCPLAAARISHPVDVACYQALRNAVASSQKLMSADVWLVRWGPVAASLDRLLRRVPKQVLGQASHIRIVLPAVG